MSTLSLNLLRYPRRWPSVHMVAVTSACAGLLAGGLLGMVWGLWHQFRLPVWTAQRDTLVLRASQETAAQARQAEALRRIRLQQQTQARDRDWQMRRGQLIALHALLGQASADQGLRVQHWQGSDKQLQLQASLPRARDWPVLQAQLLEAGPQPWQLQSLAVDADGALQLVLEASWTAPAAAPGGTRP